MKKSVFVAVSVLVLSAAFIAGYFTGRPAAPKLVPPRPAVTNAAPSKVRAAVMNEIPQLAVKRVFSNGNDQIYVYLSAHPDMKVARNYISVGPMKEGSSAVSCRSYYDYQVDKMSPTLIISGDFAYRTNPTLRIRKGLPTEDRNGLALTNDFVYTWRRPDATPSAHVADSGRYLPPGGERLVEVKARNTSNVVAEIRRILPQNVVQMLAREEHQYSRRWYGTADDDDTREISGDFVRREVRCRNVPNTWEKVRLAVRMDDGGPTNGMYLVAIKNQRASDDYRVVCISDLGLSVRECGGEVGVWVTSLMTGRPVAGAKVEVYSSANLRVAAGVSDAHGWCSPVRYEKGKAFAVVVRSASGDDMTFLALRDSMCVDEDAENGNRGGYLKEEECAAFVWTERGIYRHDEKIFLQAILRNGRRQAPKPMPLEFELVKPDGKTLCTRSVMTDACGTALCEDFTVPAEQPSGMWRIQAKIPGKGGRLLGSRTVKIEEFAPPQIRVRIAADEKRHPTNLVYRIGAEHLFGGPARQLECEGAVVFEDAPFAPAKWKGWNFGNETLGLKPNYRKLPKRVLDEKGECEYAAPVDTDDGLPKAAVKAIFEGTVFEDGGRPATARKAIECHYYPYYIGANLGDGLKLPESGDATVDLVLVDHSGEVLHGVHSVTARLERIDTVYTYRKQHNGSSTWDCERIKTVVVPGTQIRTDTDGRAQYRLPVDKDGDYVLTVSDGIGGSFARRFYLSRWGDEAVRAKLSDPTLVTITPDKAFYRVGETPRLLVKSPFAGWAMMSVMREREIYSEIVNLTNATSEVRLRLLDRDWAPNLEIYLSVVQCVSENTSHLAARAHGQTTVAIRPVENEVEVKLDAKREGQKLGVDIDAKGAAYAVVTVVDEGINLLTDEKTPDPVGHFAQPRHGEHPLFDIYGRILPVLDEKLRASGVKTGGGFGAEMLGRVSPEPTRRFKPLALWKSRVTLREGQGHAAFTLPEFVGEVRVTAVAYSDIATGSTSVRKKIVPNLVLQPDAPRFVAPGDEFSVTMPLRNTTKNDGLVNYQVGEIKGEVELFAGASTNVVMMLKAPKTPGQMEIRFIAQGLGETHEQTIVLPVRPAVAWRETTGIAKVEEEDALRAALKDGEHLSVKLCKVPTDELVSAYRWLADYPHGCLEQTSSRIFPLLSGGLGVVSNREEYVAAGVRRVESMIRENDFTMWPDCNYAPWDRDVSLYAAHFLVEAEGAGVKMSSMSKARVMKFLDKWSVSTNDSVSAYACHTLALVGKPDRDRMLRLYDRAKELDALSRARLARAFALDRDFKRAEKILETAYEPQNIREAAFTVLAMLEVNLDDVRIFPLVEYLMKNRDSARFCWGTTGDNAHALLAIGAYYRAHPGKEKEPYLVWRKLTLPQLAEVKDDSSGILIERKFYHANGEEADLKDLVRGEMLTVELKLTTDVTKTVNDLVIEDLFPACFEPVHSSTSNLRPSPSDWVMRKDARDGRMLIFSKRFNLEKGDGKRVVYPVRVVTAGDFVLPGPSVEGMYDPRLHSRRAPGRVVVRR